MRRSLLIFWAVLAVGYTGFYLWHTPLRPPLTEAEVDEALADMEIGDGTNGTITPEFVEFFKSDDGQSFYMFNLNDFSEDANYPEGLYPEITTGAEAAARYGELVTPELFRRASYPYFGARKIVTGINTLDDDAAFFQASTIVRYRSRRDFLDMVTSDNFEVAEVHKWASLDETVVTPSAPLFATDLSATVLLVLVAVGAVASTVVALLPSRSTDMTETATG